MGDLSAHFSRSEFRDHIDGTLVGPSASLIVILEAVRHIIRRPLVIVSGYRSPAHQRQLYDRLRAQDRAAGRRQRPYVVGYHPLGRAADLHPGVVTVDQALAAGARGIGRSGQWAVHVDDRRVDSPLIFNDP